MVGVLNLTGYTVKQVAPGSEEGICCPFMQCRGLSYMDGTVMRFTLDQGLKMEDISYKRL